MFTFVFQQSRLSPTVCFAIKYYSTNVIKCAATNYLWNLLSISEWKLFERKADLVMHSTMVCNPSSRRSSSLSVLQRMGRDVLP